MTDRDKIGYWIVAIVAIGFIAFWGGIAYVAMHFIYKFW